MIEGLVQELAKRFLFKHLGVFGALMIVAGLVLISSNRQDVARFHAFESAQVIAAEVLSLDESEIAVSWSVRGERRIERLPTTANTRVTGRRNGAWIDDKAARLRRGDLVEILESDRDGSVIFASERPTPPDKILGIEVSSAALFGACMAAFGVACVLNREEWSADL